MQADKFIAELEGRGVLSERVMRGLRSKVTESTRPLTAQALAKFLVQKNHLTQQQADELLDAIKSDDKAAPQRQPAGQSQQDLESADTVMSKHAGDEEAIPELPLANTADEDQDASDSSIFAPFLTGRRNAPNGPSRPGEEDELTLLPDDDDEPIPDRSPAKREITPTEAKVQAAVEAIPKEPAKKARKPRSADKPKPSDLEDLPDAAIVGREGATKRQSKKSKGLKERKRWDSPLMLIGGGGLVLMILCGATIWWLLTRESAEHQLKQAQAAMDSGAYAQAIEHYNHFLESSPRHPEASNARVQLALAQLRQSTESGNYSAALDLAENELKEIEDEEAFAEPEVHAELAALLPEIALGLARQAEKTGPGSAETDPLKQQAERALALCNNVDYIPKTMRVEPKLTEVRETLEITTHRQQTHHALETALAEMRKATGSGNASASYTTHRKLLRDYPHLAGDTALAEVLAQTTAAERQAIRFVSEEQPTETAERPVPWVAALAVANSRGPAAAAGAMGTACVRVDAAAYGLDAATGRLIWRRHIGSAGSASPIPVDNDVLVVDGRHQELLRLEAATGKLLWRQMIGEPIAEPVIVGERGYVAGESGRLYVVDLKSGTRVGYMQFAQPLRVSPAVGRENGRLYLTGDHSSLYTISLADMSCLGVHYLGHADGSIRESPAQIADKLAVVENDGAESSELHLLSLGNDGAVDKEVATRRLTGLAAAPPLVMGRRLFVATDRGQIEVYEVGAGEGSEPLAVVAVRNATGKQPIARHVTFAGRNIWIGDTQLTKYAVEPAGNRLPVVSIEENFGGDAFDHPMIALGETLIHVRRPRGRAGAVVAATSTSQGRVLWQTDLAIPPAGAPVVEPTNKTLAVANAEGQVFRFDEAAIRSRVQDQPLAAGAAAENHLPFTAAVDLGQGRAAFCAPGATQLLIYTPDRGDRPVQSIQLPSALACEVTPLANGILAPLSVGQVFYLNPADGAPLATPFQPRLAPGSTLEYRAATPVDDAKRQFVITDGRDKVYLVSYADQPQPHLAAVAEASVASPTIESPLVVLGNTAFAVAGGLQLVRFNLPSLEAAGTSTLPAPVEWGPYGAGDALIFATADDHLLLVSADGEVRWRVPMEHGPMAGSPLMLEDSVLVAYRKGIVERRSLADGSPMAAKNVEHALASGPVSFLQRLVLAAHDGTLLVIDQP